MRPRGRRRTLVVVSLYEALSLVVSTVGTLGTVYIGLRQLRSSVPAPAAVNRPWPTRLPAPPPLVARPWSVTGASLVLFVAAAAHPFAVALYYTLRYATEPSATAAELGSEGIIDVLVFGGVAFLTALLGIFVIRGSRVALWCVWALGAVSTILLCLLTGAAALVPNADRPMGFELLFLGYFAFVLVGYMVGAVLLVNAGSRAFFRNAGSRGSVPNAGSRAF